MSQSDNEKKNDGETSVVIQGASMYEEELEDFKVLNAKYTGPVLRKLLWKVDLRLIPVFALLYLLSFLDRGNVGNAKVAGLLTTIPMTDAQYNTALSCFYVFYIVFEIPSQIALKKFRPKWYISAMTLSWGLVMTLTSLIQSYHGFQVARIFLGITESGMFPAAGYTLSTWYSRTELASRVSIFFCSASIAGAFSGILAYGISFLDGKAGMEGWRWIFLIEGLITVLVGLLGPLIVLDSIPHSGKWLTDEERRFLILRQRYSTTGVIPPAEHFDWKYVKMAFSDWQMIPQIGVFITHSAIGVSISFTLPVILKSLKFTTIESYLVPVPIYAAACGVTYFNSWLGDRRQSRFLHILIPFCVAVVGVVLCLATAGKSGLVGVNLFGLILIVLASYSPVPSSISWCANNVIGYKKVISMGMLMGIGNLSGLIASNIYLTRESPRYHTGYGMP
ncbi:MFS general substrate transporter [Stereum hirsutum FP-91666 SS1]|uniref:MFS general substrate transporter n=1 Tax=Stereum hirsutum (strain FP-91666) TaxID=721885 RepID=UPI000440CF0B|nr:MFS general substrate transporter [Stereum hirsutum FP-91666 SS1]EIM91713.1 MFS general substrate transporter [Stereum hirsutum FP-91666 SS1]